MRGGAGFLSGAFHTSFNRGRSLRTEGRAKSKLLDCFGASSENNIISERNEEIRLVRHILRGKYVDEQLTRVHRGI